METKTLRPGATQSAIITVMVVEDDVSVSGILKTWINETDDFTCAGVFGDVESAAPHILQHKPNIVLMDINLPGLSGVECVRQLKPLTPQTQFVMQTVYEDSNHIFDALTAGATAYLVKTTSREGLINALREVHAGGSPMSSNIARKVVQLLQQPRKNPTLSPADELSRRENEVLALLAQGYLYKEIADTLGISIQTVNTYIRRIYEKLQVHSRSQAVARYSNIRREDG